MAAKGEGTGRRDDERDNPSACMYVNSGQSQFHFFNRGVCENCGVVNVKPTVDLPDITSDARAKQSARKIQDSLKICPKCGEKFTCFKNCQLHQLYIHKGQQLEWCFYCDALFASVSALQDHVQMQHEEGKN